MVDRGVGVFCVVLRLDYVDVGVAPIPLVWTIWHHWSFHTLSWRDVFLVELTAQVLKFLPFLRRLRCLYHFSECTAVLSCFCLWIWVHLSLSLFMLSLPLSSASILPLTSMLSLVLDFTICLCYHLSLYLGPICCPVRTGIYLSFCLGSVQYWFADIVSISLLVICLHTVFTTCPSAYGVLPFVLCLHYI